MLRHSLRNIAYIRKLTERGLSVQVIAQRCAERVVWDGPLPLVADIETAVALHHIESSAARRADDPGPGAPRMTSAPGPGTQAVGT